MKPGVGSCLSHTDCCILFLLDAVEEEEVGKLGVSTGLSTWRSREKNTKMRGIKELRWQWGFSLGAYMKVDPSFS